MSLEIQPHEPDTMTRAPDAEGALSDAKTNGKPVWRPGS